MSERAICQDTSRTPSTGAAPRRPADRTSTTPTLPIALGVATQNSPALTEVADTAGIATGEPLVDSGSAFASTADNPVTVSSSNGSTVTVSTPAITAEASDGLIIEWTTSGLPEDTAFPKLSGAEGNGQWDCADYWAINHPHGPSAATLGTALGGVCGAPAQTTVSRYQVYRYEISRGPVPGESTTGRDEMVGRATASRTLRARGVHKANSRPRAARRSAPRRRGQAGSTPRPAASTVAIWSCRLSTASLKRLSAIWPTAGHPPKPPWLRSPSSS